MFGIFTRLFTKTNQELNHLPKSLQRKAKREYIAYAKWLKNNNGRFTNKKIVPKYVWTDRSGLNWYVINNFDDATNERMNAIELQLQAMRYGVEVDDLTTALTDISKTFDSIKKASQLKTHHYQAMTKAQAKALEYKHRLTELTPERITLKLATLLYVIDGENPYIIDNELNDKKLQLIENDAESTAFFLKTSMLTYKALTTRNVNELVKELAKAKTTAKV